MIPERYGALPVQWLLESASDSSGQYSSSVALARVRSEAKSLSAILLDVNFGKAGNRLGIEILKDIRREFPTLPVLMFTSLDSAENRELVIQCMELGSNEYIEKAPTTAAMEEILKVYTDPGSDVALYGNSTTMRILRSKIARVAFSGETSVLVIGESGTGKELVARALHRQGPHKQGPFVAKNCAHSDLHLLDSELFGHEKGAYTGALAQRKGLLEEAHTGVLFLDEIADMPIELQGKLLRALETRTFRRVGGAEDLQSSFQLICATNRRPDELIQAGRLREDFYYRISTMNLHVPPLRDRGDDIPILADLFFKRFKSRGGASYPGQSLSDEFIKRLQRHSWPGNVRELRNTVERSIILSLRSVIGTGELPETLTGTEAGTTTLTKPDGLHPLDRLPDEQSDWPTSRLCSELQLALQARQSVQGYKGNQWRAEFMRLMYPECKAANAKGFDDLIKRLTQGPWGCSKWEKHPTLAALIKELSE